MFGFHKKEEKKKLGGLDKVLMGVVVGGAIGSVLGVGLAPKKGSETRKEVGQRTWGIVDQAKKALRGVKETIFGKRTPKFRATVQSSASASAPKAKYVSKSIPEEKL